MLVFVQLREQCFSSYEASIYSVIEKINRSIPFEIVSDNDYLVSTECKFIFPVRYFKLKFSLKIDKKKISETFLGFENQRSAICGNFCTRTTATL